MDEFQNIVAEQENTSFLLLFFSLISCSVFAFCLKYIFLKKGNALSNKSTISSILPIISIVTFLVITVVKSSIALSLGLVGALSIVRFRTPIKDPEELVYIFFAIAIGIGFAANQNLLTSVVCVFLMLVIWFYLSKEKKNNHDYNIIIEIEKADSNDYSTIIEKIIKNTFMFPSFIKYEKGLNDYESFIYKCSFTSLEEVNNLKRDIKKEIKANYKLHIFESELLT